jgi:hypothetical protein
MNSIIGQTFTYESRGKTLVRKVLTIFTRGGKEIYELLDPDSKKRHEAFVTSFNQFFKPHRRVQVDKKWKKGAKGKIKSRKIIE